MEEGEDLLEMINPIGSKLKCENHQKYERSS